MDKNIGNIKSWLFISDLDDTLIGDNIALQLLVSEIENHREKIIIVFNSSRPCESIRRSLSDHDGLQSLQPDYIVGALGTEIEDRFGKPVLEYRRCFIKGWNREQIAKLMGELGFEPHPQEFQTPFKASYYIDDYEQYIFVKEQLARHGHHVKVIFSGGSNLDIIPLESGKGKAIEFLRFRSAIYPDRVVVSGDSANDIDMFSEASKGIVVGNADPELKKLSGSHIFKANAAYAAGVLEGLIYWGVIPSDRGHG